MLQTASQTVCSQGPGASPYCYTNSHTGTATQAIDGVFLQLNWCNFQISAASGYKGSSCNYRLNNAGAVLPIGGMPSPCTGSGPGPVYDTCSTGNLVASLKAIVAINLRRANAGFGDLKISLGLVAGAATPPDVLNDTAVGTVALPANASGDSTSNASYQYGCVLLPYPWAADYVAAYEAAFDTLISTVADFDGGALKADIALVKIAPINTLSSEFDMDGTYLFVSAPPDKAGYINCPQIANPISGAQLWLDDYKSFVTGSGALDPNSNGTHITIIQSAECVFGDVAGHTLSTLYALGLSQVILSLPTNNGQALPYVDCGLSGTLTCATLNAGNYSEAWPIYYLYQFATDLFLPTTQAYIAASNAAAASGTGYEYSLAASSLASDWTSLYTTAITPASQIVCGLNDGNYVLLLNGQNMTLPGVPGTLISWQTETNASIDPKTGGSNCTGANSPYAAILSNGTSNGASWLELQYDAAFNAACEPLISAALPSLFNPSHPTTCLY